MRTTAATSSGSPRRPIGGRPRRSRGRAGAPGRPRTVSMVPGTTQLTVMRRGARSSASARVMPAMPALAAITWARPVAPLCAVRPPIFTIEPPRTRMRWGRQDWVHRNAPSSTVEMTRRHSSSLMSSKGVSLLTAALLTRMSRRPNCFTVASTISATASGSVTSAKWKAAVPPLDLIIATVLLASPCEVLAFTITVAPPAASEREIARPMFLAPPVTRATFPRSSLPGVMPASLIAGPSAHVFEEQEQPAEDGGVAEQDDPARVALRRVRHAPETVEDRRRHHREKDQAPDADFGVPAGEHERTAGELQRDSDPERGRRERSAERRHALDVVLDPRFRQVANPGGEKAKHDEQPSRRDLQPDESADQGP